VRLHLLSFAPLALVSCALAGLHPKASVTPTATNQPEMIPVPASLFTMGSDAGPASSHPARDVFLDAYFIDRTEVRIGDLEAFAAATHTTLAGSEELFARQARAGAESAPRETRRGPGSARLRFRAILVATIAIRRTPGTRR